MRRYIVENLPLTYKDINQIMIDNAKLFENKDFIVDLNQGNRITFSQFNYYCNKVANFLKDMGLKEEDKISVIGDNSIETMIIFFGVLKYGAVINPINREESKENIYHIVSRVRPKFVIYDSSFDINKANTQIVWIPFSHYTNNETEGQKSFFSFIKNYEDVFQNQIGNKNDIAEIIFTSGTTEKPKGVVIGREALFYMVQEVIDKLHLTENDRMLEYRAYSWASTQLLSILSSLTKGATLFLAKKFARSKFSEWIKQNDITISSGVPTVINILVSDPVDLHRKNATSLKFITSSSAPLSKEQHRKFEEIYGIPIKQMMGMSEAGWMIGNPPENSKFGSVGTAFKYKRLRIIDDNGQDCKVGEEGELLIAGKSMGAGYLTENGGIDKFPDEGFRTGDLAYMDSDGYVFISGRKKDLIIRGGINISPMEITNRILEHAYVNDAVVLGIPDKIGEEVGCFIAPKQGFEINEEDIIKHCKNTLPDFKVPKRIIFLETIPKTKRGKFRKQDLLNMVG